MDLVKIPAALLSGALLWSATSAADTWIEVRSPHFIVLSNDSEKKARETAREFDEIREVFRFALRATRTDPDLPIVIYAVEDENDLKELLPSYWERSGPRPYGVFRPAPDKYLIALRTDARGHDRYQPIYHEYFHLLTRLNYPNLPVWAREGLAEFWENTVIRDHRIELGNVDWRQLDYLARTPLIPLAEFLRTDQNPHDRDPRRVTIFYAQAWALTHWALIGDDASTREKLFDYFSRVQRQEDSVSAFTAVFGDLEEVESQLWRYARFPQKKALRMNLPVEVDESTFVARELDEAETLAAKANYLVSGRRREQALPLLDRALELDAGSALALESVGYYHWLNGDSDEGDVWFAKAVAASSDSFFVHYRRAVAAKDEGEAASEAVKAGYQRAIELNPDFAPAYAELAAFYAPRAERLEHAFDLAKKAVQLEPEVAGYWVNVGQILLRLGVPQEAQKAAERARAVARTDADEEAIAVFEELIEHYHRIAAEGAAATSTSTVPPEPEPAATTTTSSAPPRDRRVRGTFREFRCIGSDYFEFVIASDERTYVLFAVSPSAIVLTENGEATSKDLYCGPQSHEVEAWYEPGTESPIGGKVDGKLLELDFTSP